LKLLATIALVLAWPAAAAADPPNLRILSAPTAWLPAGGALVASAGLDTRGDGSISLGYGLGDLAAVEVGGDTDVAACASPPCAPENTATGIWLGRAAFRIGAHQDAWFRGQPALAFGVRTTFAAQHSERVAEAFVGASRVLGPVALHAGASLIDAGDDTRAMRARVRPTAAFELVPPQYPKTTLMADLAWQPVFEPSEPRLRYLFGWGVRYQALSWGAIELDVRHRENEMTAPIVMVRVNAVWRSPFGRR
jgi:hypothetical protein